jgi:N-acetylneuraminic acid mutarotase
MNLWKPVAAGLTAFVAFALACGPAAASTTDLAAPYGAPRAVATVEDRVACQVAVEEVLSRHRLWPAENPGPKPPFDPAAAAAALESRVEDALRQSTGLATLYGRPITGEMLQAELNRMARESRQPEVLRDIFAVLGDDPALLAECLARPVLADRLLRSFYRHDARLAKRAQPFRAWWESVRARYSAEVPLPEHDYSLPEIVGAGGALLPRDGEVAPSVDAWGDSPSIPNAPLSTAVWTGTEMIFWGGSNSASGGKENYGWSYNPSTDTWSAISNTNAPEERAQHTAVWTGTEMIVWGGCNRFNISFCAVKTGGRYNPGTDTWSATSTSGAPAQRVGHTAVWAGSRMIVWGGCTSAEHCNDTNTGGLYDPGTNSWTASTTGGAPTARHDHTAVWTNNEMIVWGGHDGIAPLATGARYNPGTNSWTPTSAAGAPQARLYHTALWAQGDGLPGEMIVWGGCNTPACILPTQGNVFGDGARYNPATNAWTPVGAAGAPSPRILHSAVWTGSEMIVWGGTKPAQAYSNGARYARTSNAWAPISNAGTARSNHRAVWTGELMIVWGGQSRGGERFSPAANTWTPVNGSDPYALRSDHTAVWTGTEMIAWGGGDTPFGTFYGSGNIYTPATASWRDTALTGAPQGRYFHTAVWTGVEMIVWGGQDGSIPFKTGGRYNPATDSWRPTSTQGAPAARGNHTAVWTGQFMIVWGGAGEATPYMNTGAFYSPVRDRWRALPISGAPSGRYLHTGVWAGNQMIVWGGVGTAGYLNDGARLNFITRKWTALPSSNVPSARYYATGVWTGTEMIVWGGRSGAVNDPTHYDTGGRYNPATNTWTDVAAANSPQARSNHTAIWTGAEMIVWGGWGGEIVSSGQLTSGGRYDPVTGTWTATDEAGAPSPRTKHTAVWTGSEMIVWGGEEDGYLNTGGHYVP